jgi:hypothetical protein
MAERVWKRLGDFNRRRLLLLEEVGQLSEEQIYSRPHTDGWSILQILQHLVLAERAVLEPIMGKKTAAPGRRGLRNLLGYALVVLVLRWDLPVPVPSEEMVPDGQTTLAELRRQWDENYRVLERHLEDLRDENSDPAVFRHPVTGSLTAAQMIRIAELHLCSHQRQIQRALRARAE